VPVVRIGNVEVEQILSGVLGGPVAYDQDHDEWALVLEGAAVLEIGATRLDLTAGDWLLLPAHLEHRLVGTRPGTSWLVLRGGPADTHGMPQ
jgi:cupin 2 domain-containing protein